jgi:hypothetical protein
LSIEGGAASASGFDVVLGAGVDLDFEAGADFRVLEFVGVAGAAPFLCCVRTVAREADSPESTESKPKKKG